MNSNIIKKVCDLLSNQDVASKNYVDKSVITTAGGDVYGDIKLNVGSDLARSLGCNDLTACKKFTTSAGVRHKYAIVFLTRFTIKCSYQDKN